MTHTERHPVEANDLQRLESQRRLLMGLLARFTGDRDTLISTVQACEHSLHTLTERVEFMQSGERGASADSPRMTEIRGALAQLEQSQAHAAAEVRATAEQALARAEEALQRLEGLVTAAPRNGTTSNDALARLAANSEALVGAVQACVQHMEARPARANTHVHPGHLTPRRTGLGLAAGAGGIVAALTFTAMLQWQHAHLQSAMNVALPRESHGGSPAAPQAAGSIESSPLLAAPAQSGDVPMVADSPSDVPGADPTPARRAAQEKPDPAIASGPAEPVVAAPAGLVSLAPEAATASVIEPEQKRVCVYRRAGERVVAEECYTIAALQVGAWPRWLVASDLTGQRLRLVDETGRKRLAIMPVARWLGPDMAQLAQPDFEALSAKITPWRTVWLVADGAAPAQQEAAGLPEALAGWRDAWEARHLDEYLGYYSAAFVPQTRADLSGWRARKRFLFEHSGTISVQIAAATTAVLDAGKTAITSFEQSYRSEISASHAFKVLEWQREGDCWRIRTETVLQERAE